MKYITSSRHFLSFSVILFYLAPLIFFASYSISQMSRQKSWSILSIGLLLVACGTLCLLLFQYYWERILKQKIQQEEPPQPIVNEAPKVTVLEKKDNAQELQLLHESLKESREQQSQLLEEINLKMEEINLLNDEKKQAQRRSQQSIDELSEYKIFAEEQLKQKQLQLQSLQLTCEKHKEEMEAKASQVQQLETKIHDLNYEVKTLIYLQENDIKTTKTFSSSSDEIPASPFLKIQKKALTVEELFKTHEEALALLKKCLLTAEKLTGNHYHGSESSRHRDLSVHSPIDQRRLFDSLRYENGALIVIYSLKDHKLIFVNDVCQNLLGWTPEKFTQDFSLILQGGIDWKKLMEEFSPLETQKRLIMKTKDDHEIMLHCHLGSPTMGLFKHYVFGIMYPALR